MVRKVMMPFDKMVDRFPEVFNNGTGAVDRSKSAFLHILKYGLIEAAYLQAVDDDGRLMEVLIIVFHTIQLLCTLMF